MCIDPASLAIIGTVVSAGGQLAAGQAANASAQAQAQSLEQQQEAERRSAAYEITQQDRKNQLEQAAARAAIGASGVSTQGSPSAVLTANAGQNQMDLEAIRYGSALRQNSLGTQADISRMQGKQAKTASFINAGSSLIGGFSRYSEAKGIKFGQNPFR